MSDSLLWKRKVLPNGLRVLLFPRSSGLTTQISVAVEYGSNDDSEDKSGTAHFLEHMIPGGSQKRIELARDIERLGGCLDFFTTPDCTITVADVMTEKMDKASRILLELLFGFDSSFENDNFERERKIIQHEIAESSDDPWTRINEMITECLFKTHPIKRPVSGCPKTIAELNMKVIEESYITQYSPQNMILAITGKFSDTEFETVLQNFANAKNAKRVSKVTHLEKGKPERGMTKKKLGISQTYLSIGAKTVPGGHGDIPALQLLNTVLGEGASSRLFIELREKNTLAYNIESLLDYGVDYGYFHVDCAIKSTQLNKTTNLIQRELARICSEKIPEEELNKAKDMTVSDVLREIDSPAGLPQALISLEIFYESKKTLAEYLEEMRVVTSQEIIEVANKYLQSDNCSTVILTPKIGPTRRCKTNQFHYSD
jgi:predicted Zn-dependent peptidase